MLLQTQDGKFLKVYNEWGYIELVDVIDDGCYFNKEDVKSGDYNEQDLYYLENEDVYSFDGEDLLVEQ